MRTKRVCVHALVCIDFSLTSCYQSHAGSAIHKINTLRYIPHVPHHPRHAQYFAYAYTHMWLGDGGWAVCVWFWWVPRLASNLGIESVWQQQKQQRVVVGNFVAS